MAAIRIAADVICPDYTAKTSETAVEVLIASGLKVICAFFGIC